MRKAFISLLLLESVLCCWSGIAVAAEAEPANESHEAAALAEGVPSGGCLADDAENSDSANGEDAVQADAIQPNEQVSSEFHTILIGEQTHQLPLYTDLQRNNA